MICQEETEQARVKSQVAEEMVAVEAPAGDQPVREQAGRLEGREEDAERYPPAG